MSDIEWFYGAAHSAFLAEKYKYQAKKCHVDYVACSFEKIYPECTIATVINNTITSEKKPVKRYCVPEPDWKQQQEFTPPAKKRKVSFRKTKSHRSFRLKRKKQTLKRSCKKVKRQLFVHPKKLLICTPSDTPLPKEFDPSVLYPKHYHYTKPDSEYDFQDFVHTDTLKSPHPSKDTESDIDFVTSYMEDNMTSLKNPKNDHDKAMQRLLTVDFTDMLHISDPAPNTEDAFKPEDAFKTEDAFKPDINPKLEDKSEVKHFVKRFHSMSAETYSDSSIRALNTHRRHSLVRKRQLEEQIHVQENVLKRLKLELDYYERKTQSIDEQLDLRRTIGMTASLDTEIPLDTATKVNDLKSKLLQVNDVQPEDVVDVSTIKSTEKETDVYTEAWSSPSTSKDNRKKHKCSLCSKSFIERTSFDAHVLAHSGTSYKCDKCDPQRHFTVKKSYKDHMRWHDRGQPMFTCEKCHAKFERDSRLRTHMFKHLGPTLKCRVHEKCEKIFTFESNRINHERYGYMPKLFQCETCDKCFQTPKYARTHHLNYGHSGLRYIPEETS